MCICNTWMPEICSVGEKRAATPAAAPHIGWGAERGIMSEMYHKLDGGTQVSG